MSLSQDDMKSQIEENLNRSGYAVELFIHSLLEAKDQLVLANAYFLDNDKNEARSVDLVVQSMEMPMHTMDMNPTIDITMVIECKKSENNAWVFFENNQIVYTSQIGQFCDYRQIVTRDFEQPWAMSTYKPSLETHYGNTNRFSKIANSYTIIRKGKIGPREKAQNLKDDIFEAINQVLKFIAYDLETERFPEHDPKSTAKYGYFTMVYYPVIVFDGLLYNGHLKGEKIELTKKSHIMLTAKYRPKYAKKQKTFYIDVVTKDYFEKYFEKIIEPEIKLLVDSAVEFRERMYIDANYLSKLFREASFPERK